jgi:glutamyl-Q tRNA(Asp) synthetase
LQGTISQNLGREHGDFVLRRRDQIVAYQFAVVVDDHQQQINHVVRGADLLDSTPKQLYLQQLLGYPAPKYMHLPVIVDHAGHKLSKQTLAAPVDSVHPAKTLWQLLSLLQQNPPAELQNACVGEQLAWATKHWQPLALQQIRIIQDGRNTINSSP